MKNLSIRHTAYLNTGLTTAVLLVFLAASFFVSQRLTSALTGKIQSAQLSVAIGGDLAQLAQAHAAALRYRSDQSPERAREALAGFGSIVACADNCQQLAAAPRLQAQFEEIRRRAKRFMDLFEHSVDLYRDRDGLRARLSAQIQTASEAMTAILSRVDADDGALQASAIAALTPTLLGQVAAERYLGQGGRQTYQRASAQLRRSRDKVTDLVGALSRPADLYDAGRALGSVTAAREDLRRLQAVSNRLAIVETRQLDVIGPELSERSEALRTRIIDGQTSLGERALNLLDVATQATLALSAAAIAISFALALYLARTIAKAVVGLSSAMRSLAAGVLDVEVDPAPPTRELQSMAAALAVFRRNTELAMNVERTQRQQRKLTRYARALEEAKSAAEQASLTDPLTMLRNRRALDIELDQRARSIGATERLQALHIDLDRFKQINDAYGHKTGDQLLRRVADMLREITRSDDFVARVGGDEFVILCAPGSAAAAAERVAERVVAAFAEPAVIEGRICRFGASVGVASAPQDGVRDLIANADVALYYAKQNGRGQVARFSGELRTRLIEQKQISDDIWRGVEREEFIPYFQPQFDAVSHEIVGVECLARWSHPELGALTPAAFLKVAEENGALARIDELIMHKAVDFCKRAEAQGLNIPKCSVNVSFDRLSHDQTLSTLPDFSGISTRFAFELLETIFFDDGDDALLERVQALRARGLEIEIDDFGSGRASIVSLVRVEPDRLKIDKTLVKPIVQSLSHRRLLETIIDMGASHAVGTIAEGVETMAHAEILRDLGCDALQGYAFGRPMPAEQTLDFLADKKRGPARPPQADVA